MTTLVLNLRKEYFSQIRDGLKTEEFRLCTPYWHRRLVGRSFDLVEIRCGYPKRGDTAKIITKRFGGFVVKTITHPHFGAAPVEVFAIQLLENT